MEEETEDCVQDGSNKRSLDDNDDDADNNDNARGTKRQNTGGRPLLKLLIPNYAAGALIGRGGQLLHELEQKYGGSVRLSSNRECYPGSNERIVVIMGEINQIININKYIMEKVQDPGRHVDHVPREEQHAQIVKIVLTGNASGLLIGVKGGTIKGIQDECSAKISISAKERIGELGERVVIVSGSMDQRIKACKQIIEKIANEPSNMSNTKLRYSNGDISTSRKPKLKLKVVATLEIPDNMVGRILGKNGIIIRDLGLRSGARFKFSEKDELTAGTNNRTLTITGNMSQTSSAYNLINERMKKLISDTQSGDKFSTNFRGECTKLQFNRNLGTQYNNELGGQYNDRYPNQSSGRQYDDSSGSQFPNTHNTQFSYTPGPSGSQFMDY